MPVKVGYWTRRTSTGYEKLPVYFYFDDAGNLVAMRDPYGNVKTFQTTVSQRPGMISYHANACDYIIATAPKEAWFLMGGQACVRTGPLPTQYICLQHSLEDIAAKRPDVADYLGITPRAATQAVGRSVKQGQEVTPKVGVTWPVYNNVPTKATGTASQRADLYPLFKGIYDQFAQAMTGTNPLFAALYRAMYEEGARQEEIVRQRLSPERYQYYLRLREQAGLVAQTHEQYRAMTQAIWKAMVKEAGLTEQQLAQGSPYLPQIGQVLSQLMPQSQVGALVSQKVTQLAQGGTPVQGTSTPSTKPTQVKPVPVQFTPIEKPKPPETPGYPSYRGPWA